MTEPAKLLSIGKAAKRLGIPVSTLRSWSNRGLVATVVTPTGRRLYAPNEIERLAADLTPAAPVAGTAPKNGKEDAS